MMVPRDSVPLTLFIQISLAIHPNPKTQPATNLKTNHGAAPGQRGMSSNKMAAKTVPDTMQRLKPRRAMACGYRGPHRITAIKLAAVTAPMTKLEYPIRLKLRAIRGG